MRRQDSLIDLKASVLSYLKANGQVKRKRLLTYLHNMGFERATTRDISYALNEITDIDGLIIKSDGKGIKLAETAKEYEAAIKFYRSYALSYLKKTRIAKRNFARLTSKLFVTSPTNLTS